MSQTRCSHPAVHKVMTGHDRIHNSRGSTTPCLPPLPTDFNVTLLSHYREQVDKPATPGTIADITPTGINVYCPRTPIPNYQRLIWEELALRYARLEPPRPVTELHLVGAPLRQFSADAITELTFRLGNKITFAHQNRSARGATISLADFSRDRIALLVGLGYSRLTLSIDATVASADRSLARIEAAMGAFTEFDNLAFAIQLLFGDQTDPRFLTRLVNLIAASGCERLELSYPGNGKLMASARVQRASDNFLHLFRALSSRNWRVFGNHIFVPPQVPHTPSTSHPVQYTPWGLRSGQVKHWIGLGLAALGKEQEDYQLTVAPVSEYCRAIRNQRLPVTTRLTLPGTCYPLATILQTLICQHRAADLPPAAAPVVDHLVQLGWVGRQGHGIFLTEPGILHLPTVTEKIFSSFE